MSKTAEKEPLDFMEADLLYCWGCSDYADTLDHISQLGSIAGDPEIKMKCEDLLEKLFFNYTENSYRRLYNDIRAQLKAGMHSKICFASELLDYERR